MKHYHSSFLFRWMQYQELKHALLVIVCKVFSSNTVTKNTSPWNAPTQMHLNHLYCSKWAFMVFVHFFMNILLRTILQIDNTISLIQNRRNPPRHPPSIHPSVPPQNKVCILPFVFTGLRFMHPSRLQLISFYLFKFALAEWTIITSFFLTHCLLFPPSLMESSPTPSNEANEADCRKGLYPKLYIVCLLLLYTPIRSGYQIVL